MGIHLIIDADPVVYRSGFAAETHNYSVVAETEDGELIERYFHKDQESSAGDRKKAWLKENPDVTVLTSNRIVDVEPLEYCLRGVKMTMKAIVNTVEDELNAKVDRTTVLLSGPDNFRIKLATIKPYKGNRKEDYKPEYYQQIRNYLTQYWGAKVIHGREADDECSIQAEIDIQGGNLPVVASIDKDLDQIPGMHYDYAKKVLYFVDREDGDYLFHKQTLTGDSTDNIQGLFRVGDKAADKLLAHWGEGWEAAGGEENESWEEAWWRMTVGEYAANMEKYPDKYPEGMTAEEAALETARLVFMQKTEGQLWTAPNQPHKLLEDEL